MQSDQGLIGKVEWWDPRRGFGFISVGGREDVFCHYSAILDSGSERRNLLRDQRVTLRVVEGRKGLLAASVKITS